ncbi:uncharacterized protein TM35_000391960 [Trypanosoma theileri]|uniref:Uncharacterized protein n=1 Tax=Trypanosoma theileri TaxID=67003 RepID=A0A1X0NJU9_9TRYP|nr:uncharacterized protein TM35_000391960 [Trypanosoma theileri]ORC85022.1 hypothetical protein TM35_000391960 [Trypanosoma theileri]
MANAYRRLFFVLHTLLIFFIILLFWANWRYSNNGWNYGNPSAIPPNTAILPNTANLPTTADLPNSVQPNTSDLITPYPFLAELDTLELTGEELQDVSNRHEAFVSYNASGPYRVCPERYIIAKANEYGRHHNQMEEYMNTILWAERLNRTAVLGGFWVKGHWVDPAKIYDFSKIAQRYCVISDKVLEQKLLDSPFLENLTYTCYGWCIRHAPLGPLFQRMQFLEQHSGLPPYVSWEARKTVMKQAVLVYSQEQADVMVIGGQYAFLLHHGLVHHAAIYSLLQPSPFVRKKVDEFLNYYFSSGKQYIGIHKRHRESSCKKGLREKMPDFREYTHLSPQREKLPLAQCVISISYLDALHTSLGLKLFSFPLFVAHDHQDKVTIRHLAMKGARLYDKDYYPHFEDCEYGLCSLAMDYFLLVEGEYFSGNVISSVSENVCFARLGKGKACHGMEPGIIRLLTHDVIEPYKRYK